MTRIDANLADFEIEWDPDSTPMLLISAWGVIDEAVAVVPDVVGRPDMNGDVTVHLLPTTHESGFYSVQLVWTEGNLPCNRLFKIRVPVEGPARILDLVIEAGQE